MRIARFTSALFGALLLFGVPVSTAGAAGSDDLEATAEEAYIYGLPLIMSYKTMYFYAVNETSPQFKAPFNQLKNTARVYGPKDTAVVSPNSDTPYSLLWMDLRAEPVVLCVPEIEKKRYYSIMFQDLSTYLLPYVGSRATGNGAGCYMVAGPGWKGEKPKGIDQVMQATADFVFAVYRTQLFDAKDLDKVKKVQAGYKVETLSSHLGGQAPAAAAKIDFPAWDEKAATGTGFIAYLNFLMRFVTPDEAEKALWDKLAKIGVGPGKAFDYSKLPADRQQAIAAGVKSAVAEIKDKAKKSQISGHSQADYKHDWLLRAAVTQLGWGANDAKEASYPVYRTDADGKTLDGGKHDYTLTFPKGQLPPVKSFWSVTMYDGKTQLMIENPIKRYLINSPMLSDLKKESDGSLTLYIQKDSPGKDKESNWLPAPDGDFYMLLRLYWPEKAVLDGTWKKPEAKPAGAKSDSATKAPAQYLFVQTARYVSSKGDGLTLHDVAPTTLFFSDRPQRIVGHGATHELVSTWSKGKDSFAADPPNATLSVLGDGEIEDIVVELMDPRLSGDDLTYKVKVLDGTLPSSAGAASLFIDVIGRPLTPMSVAGVARRTTRRVVRRREILD